MTSKLKCPVCSAELSKIDDTFFMTCPDCDKLLIGTPQLWQALIQAKQDLVIAKSTLDWLGYEFPPAYPEKNVIAEMRQKARAAVKTIEHKE